MIRLIIFDYGGVFTAEKSGLYGLCKKFSEELKLSPEYLSEVYHRYWNDWKLGNLTMNELYDNFLRDINVKYDKEKLINITLDYSHINRSMYNFAVKLRKNYKVVCLTNHTREWFANEVKRFDLNEIFDEIFSSYNLKMAKPNPEIYKVVLDKMNVKPGEAIFIDDVKDNVGPASDIGIKTIVFKSYSQLQSELAKLGVN